MNELSTVRILSMKEGALFFGAFVQVHIFSHYDSESRPMAYCGLVMNRAKPLTHNELHDLQDTLDSGVSRLEAGVCSKCYHQEKQISQKVTKERKRLIDRRKKFQQIS